MRQPACSSWPQMSKWDIFTNKFTLSLHLVSVLRSFQVLNHVHFENAHVLLRKLFTVGEGRRRLFATMTSQRLLPRFITWSWTNSVILAERTQKRKTTSGKHCWPCCSLLSSSCCTVKFNKFIRRVITPTRLHKLWCYVQCCCLTGLCIRGHALFSSKWLYL